MFRLILRFLGLWWLLPLAALAQNKFTLTATPAVYSAGGGTTTFSVALNYGASVNALSVRVVAPNLSWTYLSAAGVNVPQIVPDSGDTGNLGDGFGFLYFNIPPGAASFSFTLRYPAKLADPQIFQAWATVTDSSGAPTVLTAAVTSTPTPVVPIITTQPADTAAMAGDTVTFTVANTGTPPLAYQWRKNGANIAGATDPALVLAAVQTTDGASYDVVVTNAAGSVTSRAAKLTVTVLPLAPVIGTQPQSIVQSAGGIASFTVTASGTPLPTYQWQRLPASSSTWANLTSGTTYAGVTTATLTVSGVSAAMTGDQFRCIITNSAGRTTTDAATLTISSGAASPSRLTSLSIRIGAGTGDQTLIVGFIVSGDNKSLLVRGVGPTLAQYGVVGFLADPQLKLFNGNAQINSNDNWFSAANASQVVGVAAQLQEFTLPANSRDAALLSTLNNGVYTAQVSGVGNTTGIALVEVYDANAAAASRLTGVSARTQVGTGDNILIAGFGITGTLPLKVLVRGVGPSLASFGVAGVLTDPQLVVKSGATVIATNDNWSDAANADQIAATATRLQDFPLPAGSKDAALLLALNPGTYTVQVSGIGNTTGVALVEVYEAP